jgi:hypothetical protein
MADMMLLASGGALKDDATLMVLDWHGQHGIDRATVSGTDSDTASHRLP